MTVYNFATSDCPGGVCGPALKNVVENLQAGDVLNIASGTYDVGATVWNTVQGTIGNRITVRGNAAARPLLRGNVSIRNSYYTTFEQIRFQATIPGDGSDGSGSAALGIRAGIGWTLRRCDVSGTMATNAFGQLTMPDDPTFQNEPNNFLITECHFYDPYVNPDPQQGQNNSLWHQIYITFPGNAQTGGTIEKCIFFGCKSGTSIKLGVAGGAGGDQSPRNVLIRQNTFHDCQSAIGYIADARNCDLEWNLFAKLRDWDGSLDPGVRLHAVPNGNTNNMSHTYGWDMGPMVEDSEPLTPSTIVDDGDNLVRAQAPNFNSKVPGPEVWDGAGTLPNRFVPTVPAAYLYGVTSSGGGPPPADLIYEIFRDGVQIGTVTFPLGTDGTFTDPAVLTEGSTHVYEVRASDGCNVSALSQPDSVLVCCGPPKVKIVRVYAEDNGAGKTRLMAQFDTGAPVPIPLAIQP